VYFLEKGIIFGREIGWRNKSFTNQTFDSIDPKQLIGKIPHKSNARPVCKPLIPRLQNFGATATDSQLGKEGLENEDGSKNGVGQSLADLDTAFTAIFTVELLVNMFARWWKEFFTDSWCLFDFFIVSMSLVSLGPINVPTGVLRCLRALRVLRLFARIRAVRQILDAVSQSIIPVFNSFLIMLIVTCICEWNQTFDI
jgi:hypothetical protein